MVISKSIVKLMLKFYDFDKGKETVNVEPTPTLLEISSNPSLLLRMCLTIDSPNPVPPTSRDRATSVR